MLASFATLVMPATVGMVAAQRPNQHQVIISVLDKQNAPVASLAPEDVTIKEDGKPREVLAVGPATSAMQIALLVDTGTSASRLIPDLRDSLKVFTAAIWAKSPDTEIALYTFGERPTLDTDFSTSAVALNRRIERLFASSGSGSTFVDAVVEVSEAVRKRKAARPVIVAFVDEDGPDFSHRRHDQAFDALTAARASLWVVTRQGFSNNSQTMEGRERAQVIGDGTTRSGGRNAMVFDGTGLKVRFTDLASQLLSQFVVTYGRPETLIPPERIEVRLTKPDLKLAAPRWTGK
jgi:hypothetical protein